MSDHVDGKVEEAPGKFSAVYDCAVLSDRVGPQKAYLSRAFDGMTFTCPGFELGAAPDEGRGVRLAAFRRYRITVEEVTE